MPYVLEDAWHGVGAQWSMVVAVCGCCYRRHNSELSPKECAFWRGSTLQLWRVLPREPSNPARRHWFGVGGVSCWTWLLSWVLKDGWHWHSGRGGDKELWASPQAKWPSPGHSVTLSNSPNFFLLNMWQAINNYTLSLESLQAVFGWKEALSY